MDCDRNRSRLSERSQWLGLILQKDHPQFRDDKAAEWPPVLRRVSHFGGPSSAPNPPRPAAAIDERSMGVDVGI